MRRAVFLLLLTAFFIVMGEGIPRAGAFDAENLPNKASLSANRMRFDSKTGDFIAAGNVVTLSAPPASLTLTISIIEFLLTA